MDLDLNQHLKKTKHQLQVDGKILTTYPKGGEYVLMTLLGEENIMFISMIKKLK
ncbi:hypothetical protein SD77_1455 [Bacillus badius]|uniref:Mobile element protein n=1 Tax=Bacillus badius TaxID=1455 RepID=A0ABR5AS39_BACBA|nr:hypothetical protein SD78_3112 [Bacillus badius]KIL77469.1 hypothetical protein SD77_1455 [Bacillus badius]